MGKITVDQDLCYGCGACVSACPECFEFNSEGKSHPLEGASCSCDLDEVALNCPVQAITIHKEG